MASISKVGKKYRVRWRELSVVLGVGAWLGVLT